MKPNESKITTYLGFAVKSHKIIYGTDDVLKNKNSKIILISNSLSEGSLQKLETHANAKNIPLKKTDDEIFLKVFGEKNVKVVAITDDGLANAIKNLAI